MTNNLSLHPRSSTATIHAPANRPSPVSTVEARSFTATQPFARFGEWGPSIRVARPGTGLRLARWLALNRAAASSPVERWQACQEANTNCFQEYRIVSLRKPSFFLPAGEVVFQVLANPTQIPDHPPRGVLLRHWEAMISVPRARFFFLRPVFTMVPHFRLYTAQDLREDAEIDEGDALFAARMYGWAFRSLDWSRQRAIDTARLGLQLATAATQCAQSLFVKVDRTRRFGQTLLRGRGGFHYDGRHGTPTLADEAIAFRRAQAELWQQMTIDPVLCFEVPEHPGQLWFEAHWYEGRDGRTYVHY